MKGKMDIEDLYKQELGTEKVTPSAKSFAQLRWRYFRKKFGFLTIGTALALGTGAFLMYNSGNIQVPKKEIAEGNRNKVMQNTNTPVQQTLSKNKVINIPGVKKAVTESNAKIPVAFQNAVPVDEKRIIVGQKSQNEIASLPVANEGEVKKTNDQVNVGSAGKTSKAMNTAEKEGQGKQQDTAKSEKNQNSDLLFQQVIQPMQAKEKTLNPVATGVKKDSNGKEKGIDQDHEKVAVQNLPVKKHPTEQTVGSGDGVEEATGITALPVEQQSQEQKQSLADSTAQNLPFKQTVVTDSALVEVKDSTKKRQRKFKITLGALYHKHFSGDDGYDYGSTRSFTFQSGIKYPFLQNQLQANIGFDFTTERHHFVREDFSEVIFDEVNEIHLSLHKMELPLSVDYKLPLKGGLTYRVGAGIKFSKIFWDEEFALNKEEEEIFHPNEEDSFLVDRLAPLLTQKFIYVNVSKAIKNVRMNFQMFYYFKQDQMETHSEIFVNDNFSISSARLGVSVDF